MERIWFELLEREVEFGVEVPLLFPPLLAPLPHPDGTSAGAPDKVLGPVYSAGAG